jgi:hypothetical protein
MNKTPKGKQATRGEKLILEENEQTIKFYFNVYAGSSIVYFVIRYFLFWESFTTKFMILFALTSTLSGAAYYFINRMGKPLVDENGKVIGAGSDLNMQGHISEYAKDIILFAAIVFFSTLISDYFWLLLLVAPCYAFYLIWKNFLGPWFFAPAPEPDEQQDQKKVKEKRRIIRR